MEITRRFARAVRAPDETSGTPAYRSLLNAVASAGGATIAAGQAALSLKPLHLEILSDRGLDPELLLRLGVHSSAKLRGECIAIPYWRGENIVNRKYRTIAGEKAMMQDAGAEKCFWNVDVLHDPTLEDQPVIITEGEFDAMSALQAGFSRVVSVPDGAPALAIGENTTKKYDYLNEFPKIDKAAVVIIASDGDGPGENLLHDLSLRLGRLRCKWVQYPYRSGAQPDLGRCKDLNEVLQLHGTRGVVETINRARYIAMPGLYRMNELPPVPAPVRFRTHIEGMGDRFHARLGDFIVVTGIPGHGKSTFVNELCFNLAREEGLGVAFASFEQMPQREHRRNLRTLFTGKWVKDSNFEEIAEADQFINEKFSFIVPDEDDSPTIAWVLERAKAAVVQHFAKVIVIDPWNEMDHQRPDDVSLTEYVGESIKALKRFARNYNVVLIVVAHPAKMRRDKDGNFPVPNLYDISDSANWANKADAGLVIHRGSEGASMVRLAKSRYGDIGVVGDWSATFDTQTLRFKVSGDNSPPISSHWSDT